MTLIALLIPILIYADGWTASNPSHSTLYADTITSKTDASSVNIADSQGLFVTGDITTLGKVGIGTTAPTFVNAGDGLHIKGTQAPIRQEGSAGTWEMFTDGGNTWTLYSVSGGAEKVTIPAVGGINIRQVNNAANALTITDFVVGGANTFSANNFINMNYNTIGVVNVIDWQVIDVAHGTGSKALRIRGGSGGTTPLFNVELDGNVGIGTAGPDQKLVVAGDIKIASGGSRFLLRNAANNADITALQRDGSDNLELGAVNSGANLIFYTNAIERMRINSGNVGIGTTSPTSPLHISGGGSDTRLNIQQRTASVNSMILFQAADGATTQAIIGTSGAGGGLTPGDTANSLVFRAPETFISENGGATRVAIKAGGNVGIGTTSPGAKLDVVNTVDQINLRLQGATGQGNALLKAFDGANERMELQPGGVLTLKGTASFRALHDTAPEFRLSNVAQSVSFGRLFSDGTDVALESIPNTAKLHLRTTDPTTGTNNRLTITPSGNVGIGTTNPGAKQTILGGDVYIATIGNGIILKDVDGTCRRVILSGGSLSVSGVIACPAS